MKNTSVYIKRLLSVGILSLLLIAFSSGKVVAANTLIPNGVYATTITFQDNGEVETGTLHFKPDGTLIETNTAVPGDHNGTWQSTGINTFSLQFSEKLPNGYVVVVHQNSDQFTQGTDAFQGISQGTVYDGNTVLGQRTAIVTAVHN